MIDAEPVQWVAVTVDEDKLSNATREEAEPVELQALVAGRSSTESTSSRQPSVLTGKTLYLLDTDVEPSPDDWFRVRGERYDVVGESHRWGDMGVEVAVTRAKQQETD